MSPASTSFRRQWRSVQERWKRREPKKETWRKQEKNKIWNLSKSELECIKKARRTRQWVPIDQFCWAPSRTIRLVNILLVCQVGFASFLRTFLFWGFSFDVIFLGSCNLSKDSSCVVYVVLTAQHLSIVRIQLKNRWTSSYEVGTFYSWPSICNCPNLEMKMVPHREICSTCPLLTMVLFDPVKNRDTQQF